MRVARISMGCNISQTDEIQINRQTAAHGAKAIIGLSAKSSSDRR
jgi:hypothetical protein